MSNLLFRALNEYDTKFINYGIFGKKLIRDNKNSDPNELRNRAVEQLNRLKNAIGGIRLLINKEVLALMNENRIAIDLLGKIAYDYYDMNGIGDFFDVSDYIQSQEQGITSRDLNVCIFDTTTFADFLTLFYYQNYCYSLINSHLANFKDLDTCNHLDDWISFGFNISDIGTYYRDQKDKHAIAVIENNIGNDNLIGEQFHNKEESERLASKVLNQNFKLTSVNYIALSYYQAIYFSYIPKEKIKSILGALEVDLLINNMYNDSLIFSKTKEEEETIRRLAKERIRERMLKDNKPELAEIFTDTYINNIPVNTLIKSDKYKSRLGYLLEAKREILSSINCANDSIICSSNAPQKILLMEEK